MAILKNWFYARCIACIQCQHAVKMKTIKSEVNNQSFPCCLEALSYE